MLDKSIFCGFSLAGTSFVDGFLPKMGTPAEPSASLSITCGILQSMLIWVTDSLKKLKSLIKGMN